MQTLTPASDATPSDLTPLWGQLAGADDAKAFCEAWLALLCGQIEGTRGALLVLAESGNTFVPAAVWPSHGSDLTRLGDTVKAALQDRRGQVTRLASGAAYVAYPVEVDSKMIGAVALEVAARSEDQLQEVLRALHWGAGRLEVIFQRRAIEESRAAVERARIALDVSALVGEGPGIEEAGIALVNELATRLGCERVALGIERRGRIRLRAISHAATFDKKGEFVGSIESAMEEAVDQRKSVAHPPVPGQAHAISVAHRELAGSVSACTVVVSTRGTALGAITCLRTAAVDLSFVLQLEAVAALIGSQLAARRELSRWFAGRLAEQARKLARNVSDPRRPAFMAGALLLGLSIVALLLADAEYRVSAKAVIEGEVQRALVAPFDGFIASADVRAGQTVKAGQPLATLDDRDLRLESQRWLSEVEQAERKYRDALAKRERASSRILQAQLAEAEAQLSLADEKLARTHVKAPFDGVVVSGDLSQLLSSPIEKGKLLFEIAPLDAYRVILKVDEGDIRHVAPGQRGKLMLSGSAGREIPFLVKNVSVASAEEGRNVFRVEAQVDQATAALRPGMEGVGKVVIGERGLLWIWTHGFFDWLRLKLWRWLP